jgi:HEAT repeat protein
MRLLSRAAAAIQALTLCLACAAEPEPEPRAQAREPLAERGGACDLERLATLISAPHNPAPVADVRALCPEPIEALLDLATEASRHGVVRLRAIELLGELGGPRAVTTLDGLSRATAEPASVRRAALAGLGRALPPADSVRARAGRAALSDADPHVRVAAARLLAGSSDPKSRAALDHALSEETEAFVRSAIERARAE